MRAALPWPNLRQHQTLARVAFTGRQELESVRETLLGNGPEGRALSCLRENSPLTFSPQMGRIVSNSRQAQIESSEGMHTAEFDPAPWWHTCNIRGWKQEDQKFKVSLG